MSLWLDETTTFWVIRGGWHETIDRALHYEAQSPFYYLIARIARSLGGNNLLTLRAPSILAAGLATFFLFRLGFRLFGRESAWLAALLFAVAAPFVIEASDARPYTLGVMFLVAATWALVRWVDDGRMMNAVMYVLLASLTVYAHYLPLQPCCAVCSGVGWPPGSCCGPRSPRGGCRLKPDSWWGFGSSFHHSLSTSSPS